MILDNIVQGIGNTPIVRLRNIGSDSGSSIYVKLEMFNPGGSHKTRIAFNMIKSAETEGRLRPGVGDTILEPTGGNTGMGVAIAGAVLGYKVVLVIPDNYSESKQRLLRAFGTTVINSDSRLGNNSHGQLAMELQFQNPDYVMLNQAANPANPDIHRKTTAQEILTDFSGTEIHSFVGGIGTGGHITGIGEVLKDKRPGVQIIGVQPEGCDLLKGVFVPHKIQGLAVGIIPPVLNVGLIDRMFTVSFTEAKTMMRRMMTEEGLSVGLSSGANIAASLQLASEIGPGHSVLTMAYDAATDYAELLEDTIE